MIRTRLSSTARLEQLREACSGIPVFGLTEVQETFSCTRNHAAVMVFAWKKSGLVEPYASGRGGIYFNLLKDGNAADNYADHAAVRLLGDGECLVAGITALKRSGTDATTQMPAVHEYVVRISRGHDSLPAVTKARFAPRYPRWFDCLAAHSVPDLLVPGLSTLLPEMAVADAMLAGRKEIGLRMAPTGMWRPERGDLEEVFVEEYGPGIRRCLAELGASAAVADEMLGSVVPAQGNARTGPGLN